MSAGGAVLDFWAMLVVERRVLYVKSVETQKTAKTMKTTRFKVEPRKVLSTTSRHVQKHHEPLGLGIDRC
jgi:hypothetical protein